MNSTPAERTDYMPYVVDDLTCPTCGATERHPTRENSVLIRGLKVFDDDGTAWSQCLVCSGYYDENLIPHPNNGKGFHDEDKGWFSS